MKLLLIFFALVTVPNVSLSQDSSYAIERHIPVSTIYVPTKPYRQNDTVSSQGLSRISYESEVDAAKKMDDTTYLNQIVGTYLKSNDHSEIKIFRINKTLVITISGQNNYELVPQSSFYFTVKDNPRMKIILYIDPKKVIQGINIQDEKTNYAALRKKI